MKLLPGKVFNPGDKTIVSREERMENIQFTVHKFTPRVRPENPDNVAIFSHFSEFGSEFNRFIVFPFYLILDTKANTVLLWDGMVVLISTNILLMNSGK
jgi:hypothetical protein